MLVPAGTKHNIVNTSAAPLKLYTLYAPPNHRDGVVHRTRADAEKDNEHFDGKTTEKEKSPTCQVLDVQVNNQAGARGPIPQASQWLAKFRLGALMREREL